MVLITTIKVHIRPPLYNNGGGPVSFKHNYENWADKNPYMILQLTINHTGKRNVG